MIYQQSDRFQFPNSVWDWIMPVSFGNFVHIRSKNGLYGLMQGLPNEDKIIIPPQAHYLIGIVINAPCFLVDNGKELYKYTKVLDMEGNLINPENYEIVCGENPVYFYALVDIVTSGYDIESYEYQYYNEKLKKTKKPKTPYKNIYTLE